MRNLKILIAFFLTLAILAGCEKADLKNEALLVNTVVAEANVAVVKPGEASKAVYQPVICGVAATVDLLAGQTIDAGSVSVSNDGTSLFVTYNTEGGWLLKEVHLYVQQTEPVSRLIPGKAPYKAGMINADTYTFTIPLADLSLVCDDQVWIQAHAAVFKLDEYGNEIAGETAYGGEITKPRKGSWFGNFAYSVQCCDNPDPDPDCETAFAYGESLANCFIEDGFSRWGWTNGPLAEGSYEFPIYAGAAKCDISKGTLVGTLNIVYENGTAVVTYSMNQGFTMRETHLHIGSDKFPLDTNGELTVAPGLYGNKHDLTGASSDSYTIPGLSGSIYVIAHAVVCGNY
jgi:hypothetical protein